MKEVVRTVMFTLYVLAFLLVTVAGVDAVRGLYGQLPLQEGDFLLFTIQVIGTDFLVVTGVAPLLLAPGAWKSSATWPGHLLVVFLGAAAATYVPVGSAFLATIYRWDEHRFNPQGLVVGLVIATICWMAFAILFPRRSGRREACAS